MINASRVVIIIIVHKQAEQLLLKFVKLGNRSILFFRGSIREILTYHFSGYSQNSQFDGAKINWTVVCSNDGEELGRNFEERPLRKNSY